MICFVRSCVGVSNIPLNQIGADPDTCSMEAPLEEAEKSAISDDGFDESVGFGRK